MCALPAVQGPINLPPLLRLVWIARVPKSTLRAPTIRAPILTPSAKRAAVPR